MEKVAVATEVAGKEIVVALVLVAAVAIVEVVLVAAAMVVVGTVGVPLGVVTVALLGQDHLEVASHEVHLGQLNRAVQIETGFLVAAVLGVITIMSEVTDLLLINLAVTVVLTCIQNQHIITILLMLLLVQSLATLPRIAPATLPQIIPDLCHQLDNMVLKSHKVIHIR